MPSIRNQFEMPWGFKYYFLLDFLRLHDMTDNSLPSISNRSNFYLLFNNVPPFYYPLSNGKSFLVNISNILAYNLIIIVESLVYYLEEYNNCCSYLTRFLIVNDPVCTSPIVW